MRRLYRVVALSSCLLSCAHAPASGAANARPTSPVTPARGAVTLQVKDLSPRFLAFYDAASKEGATPDRRWELWRSMYGFAAVPPGPDGQAMARELLDHAWPGYAGVLDRIRAQPAVIERDARTNVDRIAALLELDHPIEIKLVLYVGGMETNAFTFMLDDGVPNVALPVEGPPGDAPRLAAHELTHAVHLPLAHLPGGWERSLAQTVLTEGLAMRVVKELFPGSPDEAYTEAKPGWLREARARHAEILNGVRARLAAKDGATVAQFTFGHGTTGIEREAYYAGWLVIEQMRAKGMTYAQIARIPEGRLVAVVGEALDALIASRR